MKTFLNSMLSPDGKVSSKRFITFIAFISLFTAFYASLFFGTKVDIHLQECMQWIVLGGLGFTASEKFTKTGAVKQNNNDPVI